MYNDWLTEQRNHFNRQLSSRLPSDGTRLSKAMRYVAMNGGKRIRPLLTYAAGGGSVQQETLDIVATAIELIHCYSLVHDDLPAMDDDDWRRGKPSCHKAYDESTAILVGDALQSLSFELLSQSTLPNQVKIIHTLAKSSGVYGMAGGQALDMQSSDNNTSLEQLQTIHRLKTGCLIMAAISMGALAAEQPDEQVITMHSIGYQLGLAFQIRDDIRDVECDRRDLGKTAGKDQAQNKMTYPALLGLEKAKSQLQSHLSQAKKLACKLSSPYSFLAILNQIFN